MIRFLGYSGLGFRTVLDVSDVGAVNVAHSETVNMSKWLAAGLHCRHIHVKKRIRNQACHISMPVGFKVSGFVVENQQFYLATWAQAVLVLCGGESLRTLALAAFSDSHASTGP